MSRRRSYHIKSIISNPQNIIWLLLSDTDFELLSFRLLCYWKKRGWRKRKATERRGWDGWMCFLLTLHAGFSELTHYVSSTVSVFMCSHMHLCTNQWIEMNLSHRTAQTQRRVNLSSVNGSENHPAEACFDPVTSSKIKITPALGGRVTDAHRLLFLSHWLCCVQFMKMNQQSHENTRVWVRTMVKLLSLSPVLHPNWIQWFSFFLCIN